MKTPEGYVRDDVDKWLKAIGVYFIKPMTFGYGGSGCPDRVCCFNGRFAGIEIKREGKLPTPIQNRRMAEIRKSGGIAVWGDSAPMIIEKLKEAFGFD